MTTLYLVFVFSLSQNIYFFSLSQNIYWSFLMLIKWFLLMGNFRHCRECYCEICFWEQAPRPPLLFYGTIKSIDNIIANIESAVIKKFLIGAPRLLPFHVCPIDIIFTVRCGCHTQLACLAPALWKLASWLICKQNFFLAFLQHVVIIWGLPAFCTDLQRACAKPWLLLLR